MPTIRQYMTRSPHTIGLDQSLTAARRLMSKLRCRHLPVLDDGQLVGLLSQRDIQFLETLKNIDPDEVEVEDAMTPNPYVVSSDADLADVARTMSKRKFGSAIVIDKGKVTGVFTTTDALRALAEFVEK